MIDRQSSLPIQAQAQLLGISRGTVYYLPAPIPAHDIALMREMARLHLAHPFMGQRQLLGQLRRAGFEVGRCHVRTLMHRMGLRAMCPQPGSSTSMPAPGHTLYPYLLRGLAIQQALSRLHRFWFFSLLSHAMFPMLIGPLFFLSRLCGRLSS